MSPNDWRVHDLYGQPLAASNHYDMAIAEFKEAVSLDPKQSQVILELGAALEKKGDWLGALEQDKKAALMSANGKHQLGEAFYFSTDAQNGYKAAQLRFADHVAALKAAGKSAQAAATASRRSGKDDSPTPRNPIRRRLNWLSCCRRAMRI